MPTKTIGVTGRDYSSLAGWITYLQGATISADEIGECYNDGEITHTAQQSFSGITNSSFKVILRAATGQSFKDHVNKLTNALNYSVSNGAGLTNSIAAGGNAFTIQINNFEIRSLQFHATGIYDAALEILAGQTGGVIEDTIVKHTGAGNSSSVIKAEATMNNVLAILVANDDAGGNFGIQVPTASKTLTNCGVVRIAASLGSSNRGFIRNYGTLTLVSCYSFGFAVPFSGTVAGDYNASDGTIGFGTHNQASKTFASQFQNITSGALDLRAKAGADLLGTGDPSNSSATDILGQSRSTPEIGPHELISGAAFFPPFPPRPNTLLRM